VRVGDQVAAGDVVAELDASLLRLARDEAAAAYAAAQTRVAQAKRLLAQAERLLAQRVGNRDNMAAAEEQLRIAEQEAAARAAQRAQAEWRLAHAVVRAPFAGVVTARLAQEGNWVAAGQGIAVVTSAEQEVVAQVVGDQAAELAHAAASPRFVPFVTGHSSALISDPSSDPAAEIALTWVATNAVRDAPGQRTTVRFRFTHPHPLAAGTVGRVRWQSSARIAPPEAVTTFDGRVGVWVRRNPTAPPRFLALPDALPGRSAVVALPSGWLPEEAQIAVGRQGGLRGHTWVRVHPDPKLARSAGNEWVRAPLVGKWAAGEPCVFAGRCARGRQLSDDAPGARPRNQFQLGQCLDGLSWGERRRCRAKDHRAARRGAAHRFRYPLFGVDLA
jgi:RND family efflux transporter MFP subunit